MHTSNNGIDDSPPVSNHQNVFWIWEQLVYVHALIKRDRIFGAEYVCWLDICCEELENERGDCRVDDAVADAGLAQPHALNIASVPCGVHLENEWNESRLGPAANKRMGAEYDAHESGARTRHAAYPNDRR